MKRILLILLLFIPIVAMAQLKVDSMKIDTSHCAASGRIEVFISGAAAGDIYYSYRNTVNNKTGQQTNNPIFTGLQGGTYEITVVDYDADEVVKTVTVPTTYQTFEIDIDESGGFVCGGTIGDITMVVHGGRKFSNGNYEFRYRLAGSGAAYSAWQKSNILKNLDAPNDYEVQVTDSCGSVLVQEINIYASSIGTYTVTGTFCQNSQVRLSVSITGNNTYSWFKDGNLLRDNMSVPVWTIPSYKESDKGVYKLVSKSKDGVCELFKEITLTKYYVLPPQPVIKGDCALTGANAKLLASTDTILVNATYHWYRNGTLLQDVVGDSTLTVTKAGIYTVSISSQQSCPSLSSEPYILSLPIMYWNGSAGNNNWNDINNWNKADKTAAETLPNLCTEVHIPGNLTRYPSLDAAGTNWSIYKDPKADRIIYHFGGETSYPHLLIYNKAFVQYNWGYYDFGVNSPSANDQPTINGDSYSTTPMKRGYWYALATPLKSMASGDFALAGRPFTWQALYNMTNPDTGELISADFSKSFATNDISLSATNNNALAVQVSSYNDKVGSKDHRDLEALKGVLEYPYFENSSIAINRPAQKYSSTLGESRFYYINTQTLNLLNSPIGRMKRGAEAYRFIFEKDNNKVDSVFVNGQTVAGYKLSVTASGSSKEVLIGNPFMGSINAEKFYQANSTLIQNAGYKVFESTSNTWALKTYVANNNIGPLQAFVVTLTGNTAELLFPLEGTQALTGIAYQGGIMQKKLGASLSLKAATSKGLKGDGAILSSLSQPYGEIDSDVRKTVYPDGHATPEAFFISANGTEFNAIHQLDNNAEVVNIGIITSNTDSDLTLEFENVAVFASTNGLYPVLVDKALGIRSDLTKSSTYTFKQKNVTDKEQYTDKDRFELRLYNSEYEKDSSLSDNMSVTYIQQELVVRADQISKVVVYDMSGRRVFDSGNLDANTSVYSKNIKLPKGVCIVSIHSLNANSKSVKVIVP